MQKTLSVLILLALSAGVLLLVFSSIGQREAIDAPLDKALDFLQRSQLEWGEFRTYACRDAAMAECFTDSSIFITTFVLYSLNGVDDDRADAMSDKALDFLETYEEPRGVWRFWTERTNKSVAADFGFSIDPDSDELGSWLPPDFDDIAMASAVLTLYGRDFQDNLRLFDDYRTPEGAVRLWLIINESGLHNLAHYSVDPQDVDAETNANVLFYFGLKSVKDARICGFLNRVIASEDYDACVYCEEREGRKNYLFLFYPVSRAYAHGNDCLDDSQGMIVQRTLGLQEEDGSFGNDLDTAMALNTLMNFGYSGPEVKRGIAALLARQRADGSWGRYPLIDSPGPYYGSEELTTAIAIEALDKYQSRME